MSAESAPAAAGPFVPGLLLVLAVLCWNAFQCLQLVNERGLLQSAISEQQPKMEQSKKVRDALQSLATRTARLAKGGNANATIIVEELRKRGITIEPDAPAPHPSTEAAPAP